MPSPHPAPHRQLTLPNGLRVALCSLPRLKRCAAALRVAAGSHDVSPKWPGLAHFLEHLFFLGTERFPAEQNLMAYVQRHGGQLNASTRERVTDFFFELPPPVFAEGLERLCEMLAHPRMTLVDQLQEREVLHAEFIAWSRDSASRAQTERLLSLSPHHPLRWFHAGNRFSLPVPRQAFQQALRDFYCTYYQAGQMTLSLAGPQSLDELQALVQAYGVRFAQGNRVEQAPPPLLMDRRTEKPGEPDSHRMHLMFACEGLPEGHQQAADFLCIWMNNAQPGGLIAQMRDRGLIESLKVEVVYQFAGQILLDIDVVMPANASEQATQIQTMVLNWLAFFKPHYHPLLSEYTLLEQRRLATSGALALARHYSGDAGEPGLSEQGILALNALLDSLTPDTLLQPFPAFAEESPDITWRLPEPNPFLRPAPAPSEQPMPPAAFTFDTNLPDTGESTVYLRWTLPAPQPKLAHMLAQGLKPLIADAQQAGVTTAFTTYGNHWQLKLSGLAEPMPAVLETALQQLAHPDEQTLTRYGQPDAEPAPIPIRQLLKTLPDHFLNSSIDQETDDLQSVWNSARWVGFATGADSALSQALSHAPGTPDQTPPQAPAQLPPSQRWHAEPSDSSENAVLLFYPTPSNSLEDEAIWRLFAHRVQAPFYQRLRVEMQLGYAVFSGFRQIAGQGGLLFGVQSPGASVEQLVEHIENFLQTLPELIETADLPMELATVASQTDPASMETQAAADMLWQAHLCGQGPDYPERLQHSFAHLPAEALKAAASRIALPQTPRLVLANRPEPRG